MKRQRGFALLLVFVMAAAIAITLYNELPRVAFEAQRNREQLLIDRGEQYSRAIQLYVRKVKSYPTSIDQLEKTSEIRFLRKRYVDPMTGKSEWRAIHINAGGVYTDSLTHKPPAAKGEEKSVNNFTYEAPTVGSTAPTGPADPGFIQTRTGDRGMPMPGQAPQPGDPANPQQNGQLPGASPFPVIPTGVVVPPGAYNPGANPAQPGQPIQPGQPFPGQPPTGLPGPTGAIQPFPQPGSSAIIQPGQPFPQPGVADPSAQAGQNQALQLINNMLTNPRPTTQAGLSAPQGQQLGAGIAGFASTVERTGIKIYNKMEKYNEWEFIYDPTKDATTALGQQQRPGQQSQSQQNQQSQPNQQPLQQPLR
jgi:hypothetical protein